jgi:DNA-binding NarL/FixJ family response regulator/GGDEF domain-containing protein
VTELAPESLEVIAIVSDPDTVSLFERTLTDDALSIATDLGDGLTRVSAHVPDVAFVDVTLGGNAGLALLHHIRALAPSVPVYALTRDDRLDLAAQAIALGGAGALVMPLSGDEVLTALSEVRTRRGERQLKRELERAQRSARLQAELFTGLAELSDSETRRDAAESLLRLLTQAGARSVIVYLNAGDGARQLLRMAATEQAPNGPSFCEEMEILGYAEQENLRVLRLGLRREFSGIVLVDSLLDSLAPAAREATLAAVAAQAAASIGSIGAREQSQRGAMKDPRSSAYTFAYFVDVAGREIDMARRHKRRFALSTISVHTRTADTGESNEPTLATVERVLGAVRDTDVLARVDANEFYLLLPETSGIGAHSCRRRVLSRLAGTEAPEFEVGVGVATYPQDGGDLSRLLRVARHRSELCRSSVVETLGLRSLGLGEVVDALLARPMNSVESNALLESPRYIELPTPDVVSLVLAAMREAARGGSTRVAVTEHAGVSIGGAVKVSASKEDQHRLVRVDLGSVAGCENIEIFALVAEQGAYALVGRSDRRVVRAVHAADPLLVDLLVQRLGEISGSRVFD